MDFWSQVLSLLNTKVQQPEPYGLFHLTCFALSIAAGIFLAKKFKSPTQLQVRKILLIISIITIVLEVYKQIVCCVTFSDGEFHFKYRWFIFPFQFCSTPMYIGLLGGIFKNKKFHRVCCAYLASYSMFAGLSVMIGPFQVLIDVAGLNIQTMFCHGSMITIGIFLMCTNYVKPEFKVIRDALPMFAVTMAMAIIMNEIGYYAGLEGLNLFYISPHRTTVIPILNYVEAACPPPVPQIAYFVSFTLISFLIVKAFAGINKLTAKKSKLTPDVPKETLEEPIKVKA